MVADAIFVEARVAGQPFPSFFSSFNDKVAAIIYGPDARQFTITPSPAGNHLIAEIDPREPICHGALEDPTLTITGEQSATTTGGSAQASSLPGEATVIDVMMPYSTKAKDAYGGHSGVQAIAALSIGTANSVFLASGVAVEVRLVDSFEVTWHTQASTASVELSWLATDQTIKDLRDECGADLVSEIATLGGVTYYNNPFSLTGSNPITFAHEIGHDFGCRHDAQNANPCSTCPPYAYGYYVTIGSLTYGSVMSYIGLKAPYFSNPELYWRDVPFGDADDADNARRINEQAPTVAGWRSVQIALLEEPRFSAGGSSPFLFDLTGPTSEAGTYSIEYTANYLSWSSLTNVYFPGGSPSTITDNSVTANTVQRFYRAKKFGQIVASQVGFIRKEIPSGYSMIANQLDSGDHRISSLWPDPMEGTAMYKWDAGIQEYVISAFEFGSWTVPEMSLGPGEGAIFLTASEETLTFVGHVWQGFQVHLPQYWSMVASPVPQSGLVTTLLEFPKGDNGNKLSRMTDTDATYTEYQVSSGNWNPSEPAVDIGEAFWTYRSGWSQQSSNNNWERIFWLWP